MVLEEMQVYGLLPPIVRRSLCLMEIKKSPAIGQVRFLSMLLGTTNLDKTRICRLTNID
jgi:hypothetical protein